MYKIMFILAALLIAALPAAAQDGGSDRWKSDTAAVAYENPASIFGDSVALASGFHAGIGTGNSLGVLFSAGYQTSGGWIFFLQMVTGAAWSHNLRSKWGAGIHFTVPIRDMDVRPYLEAVTGSDLHSPDREAGVPADLYSYVSAGFRWDLGKKWSFLAGLMYSHTGVNKAEYYPSYESRRIDERLIGFQFGIALSGL